MAPKYTLLEVLKSFYKTADMAKLRDLLFSKLLDNSSRKVKYGKSEGILKGLDDLMQGILTEAPPVFVAPDLNNIPFLNLGNIDGTMLVSQQKVMKSLVESMKNDGKMLISQQNTMKTEFDLMKNEQLEIKSQLSTIKTLLEVSGMRNSPTGTVAYDTVTTHRASTASNQASSNQ